MTEKLDISGGEITLTQVLKLSSFADSGGQAKVLISSGQVRVNGEVELRKRRQMAVGDLVECEGKRIQLV